MSPVVDWLAMGGYALYVWPAYGIVFTVLFMNLIGMKRTKKLTRQKLQQWFK